MNIFQDTATSVVIISTIIMLICITAAAAVGAIALYRAQPLDERTGPLLTKYLAIAVIPSVLVWLAAHLFESALYVTADSEIIHVILYIAAPALVTAGACIASIVSLRTTARVK